MKMINTHTQSSKKPKRDKKIWNAGDVEVQDIAGESASHLDKGIISLLDPIIKLRIEMMVKISMADRGRKHDLPTLSQ